MRLYEWFEDKTSVYLVMEQCTGGELFDKISNAGNFSEREAANIFKQMMSAVNYCRTKNICHKDLKPENFMFASSEPGATLKLIDFGLSQVFTNPSMSGLITPPRSQGQYQDEGEGRNGNNRAAISCSRTTSPQR